MIVITRHVPAGQQATGVYHDPEAPLAAETGAPYNSGRGLYTPLPVMIVDDKYFETDAGSLQQAIPLNLSTIEPPENIEPPSITGTARVGETLTGDDGEWAVTPATTLTRQWFADGEEIEGATGAAYAPVADDIGKEITFTVTATSPAGTASATSEPTAAVTAALAPPVNTAAPTIAGTPTVGQVLTSTVGTWTGNPTPTYSRQWRRGASNIAGATGATYTLVAADVGQNITCVVTATNSEGTETATSNPVGPVAGIAPSFTVDPVLSGTPTVGETLTVTSGTAGGTPAAAFSRAWLRDGTEITGATGTTRVLTEDDVDAQISVRVTATNSAGSDVATSNELGPVVADEPEPEV